MIQTEIVTRGSVTHLSCIPPSLQGMMLEWKVKDFSDLPMGSYVRFSGEFIRPDVRFIVHADMSDDIELMRRLRDANQQLEIGFAEHHPILNVVHRNGKYQRYHRQMNVASGAIEWQAVMREANCWWPSDEPPMNHADMQELFDCGFCQLAYGSHAQ